MASLRRPYLVSRPLYSEESFAEQHEKIHRPHKTLWNHVVEYFTWDLKRAKKAGLSLLPIIGWMRIYQVRQWLLGDILSGISTGLVAVMQGLAFSMLANLPPSYGLYTAFFPMLTYFFLGTSRHISVGAFPVLSLMVGAVVINMVPDVDPPLDGTALQEQDQKRVMVASSMTFLVGIYQLGMGLLQVGFVVKYLSDTLVSGFTTAAAVTIVVSQLKFVLGLVVPGISGPLAIIYTLEKIFVQITSTNTCDLVTSILIMAVVFVYKEINDIYKDKLPVPIPVEVIVTVLACAVSYVFEFEKNFEVGVVGKMASGYEAPVAPNINVMKESVMEAFPVAIVGFAVAFSVAKVYSVKHDYTIDGNQELIAFGVSNIFGASFKSFAASTALSRTAIQESSGGKTQIAGLVSAMMAMIVTVALGFLLEPLPKSVLGALVIVNLKGMLMQVTILPSLWRKDKLDFVVWTQFPRCSVLANITGTDLYRDRKDYLCIVEPQGVKIFKIPSPIFFANVDFFREKLIEAVGFNPLKVLRKRDKAMRKIAKFNEKIHVGMSLKNTDEKGWGDLPAVPDEPLQIDQIDWNSGNLPAHISVPRVDLHSLLLDFAAVSFLDIAGVVGLKTVLKEFIRVGIDVYIVSCDECVLEKLHKCQFFDHKVTKSIFYPSLHDAMLTILGQQREPNLQLANTKL
ncbi:hypothetical protein NHX12_020549 [Muraenolepis orangiensis]|uniref:STAS domain-containing protein n=1 Tax=Muraenolepis orangiensis TaxID=630683 RepID=A0A9Q0EVG9_9TELE|nr:hypothetical protein NHX12_020549 [Muraenolepis orangiensis]